MNGYWCATWWHIQYVHTHINVFTLNILHALNPSANFKDKKNLPASVCLLMRCAFSLSDQFSTDTQINHIVVCMCVHVFCKWLWIPRQAALWPGSYAFQVTAYDLYKTQSVQNLSLTHFTHAGSKATREALCVFPQPELQPSQSECIWGIAFDTSWSISSKYYGNRMFRFKIRTWWK